MIHIFSLDNHILGVAWNEYTHSKYGTMTGQVEEVICICDYECVLVLYTPELQVGMKLT